MRLDGACAIGQPSLSNLEILDVHELPRVILAAAGQPLPDAHASVCGITPAKVAITDVPKSRNFIAG